MKANLKSVYKVCLLQCESQDNVTIDFILGNSWTLRGGYRNIRLSLDYAKQFIGTYALKIIGSNFYKVAEFVIKRKNSKSYFQT